MIETTFAAGQTVFIKSPHTWAGETGEILGPLIRKGEQFGWLVQLHTYCKTKCAVSDHEMLSQHV